MWLLKQVDLSRYCIPLSFTVFLVNKRESVSLPGISRNSASSQEKFAVFHKLDENACKPHKNLVGVISLYRLKYQIIFLISEICLENPSSKSPEQSIKIYDCWIQWPVYGVLSCGRSHKILQVSRTKITFSFPENGSHCTSIESVCQHLLRQYNWYNLFCKQVAGRASC